MYFRFCTHQINHKLVALGPTLLEPSKLKLTAFLREQGSMIILMDYEIIYIIEHGNTEYE